jgi:hypothetical protein
MSPAVGIGEAWPYNRNKPGSGLGVGRVAEAAVVCAGQRIDRTG